MEYLTLEEQKKTSLDILLKVDEICIQHAIKYFIAYGTLIGAVRHKGFIPWDDDIDIWIPLNEFDVFIDAIRKETDYIVYDHRKGSTWLKCFTKISDPSTIMKDSQGNDMALVPYGVSVDVFPLFPCSRDSKWMLSIRKYKRNIAMFAKCRLGQYVSFKYLPQRLLLFLYKTFKRDELYWKKKLLKTENSIHKYEYLGSPISPYLGKDIHNKNAFSETCDLEFEGHLFKAPVGWDEILKDIYGDYMELPPEEKRVSNHEEIAYRL